MKHLLKIFKHYKKNLKDNDNAEKIKRFAANLKKVKRSCPVCHNNNYKPKYKTDVHDYVKCADCGLIYAKEIISSQDYERFYKQNIDYQNVWKTKEQILRNKKKSGKSGNKKKISKILKLINNKGKCLDIGCSFGELLYGLKPYFKSVEGVELNAYTSQAGQEMYGIKIHNKDLFELKLEDASYDCIILNQVIEHLDNLEMIKEISRLLKPGGIFYIGCPNANAISMKLFKEKHCHISSQGHISSILHINMFNELSLKGLAKRYNFKIESMETDNNLDIQLNDIINFLFRKKKFIHRKNSIPILDSINVALLFLSTWFLNKTNLVSKLKMGSYLEVIMRKN